MPTDQWPGRARGPDSGAMPTPVEARPAPLSRPALVALTAAVEPPTVLQLPLPDDDGAVRSCPVDALAPEAERLARTVVRAVAEALAGRRPLAQLRPLLTPRVALLLEHLVRGGAAGGMRLAGLRIQGPRAGVVEASARLASATRSAALAVRLERRAARWQLTVLEAGLAPDGRLPARS